MEEPLSFTFLFAFSLALDRVSFAPPRSIGECNFRRLAVESSPTGLGTPDTDTIHPIKLLEFHRVAFCTLCCNRPTGGRSLTFSFALPFLPSFPPRAFSHVLVSSTFPVFSFTARINLSMLLELSFHDFRQLSVALLLAIAS